MAKVSWMWGGKGIMVHLLEKLKHISLLEQQMARLKRLRSNGRKRP